MAGSGVAPVACRGRWWSHDRGDVTSVEIRRPRLGAGRPGDVHWFGEGHPSGSEDNRDGQSSDQGSGRDAKRWGRQRQRKDCAKL